jgi:hypothetical protein
VIVPGAQGRHSSLEHENLQSLCTKMMNLFESQFVGRDEDKPAKLLEFLEQMNSEVMSSYSLNSESIAYQTGASAGTIDSLSRIIKQ